MFPNRLNDSGAITNAATLTLLDLKQYAGLTLAGPVGATYLVQARPRFGPADAWQTLTTLTLPASPYQFFDLDSPNHPQRFYRAVRVP